MSYLALGTAGTIWVVFAVSAWSKVRHHSARHHLRGSLAVLVPERMATPVTGLLVLAESVSALGLSYLAVSGILPLPEAHIIGLAATTTSLVVLIALSAGVAIALRTVHATVCLCFGTRERTIRAVHLVRNIMLLAIATVAFVAELNVSDEHTDPLTGLVALVVGFVLALLLVNLDDLVDVFVHPARSAATGSATSVRRN